MEVATGIHRIPTQLGERVNCVYVLSGGNGALMVDTAVDDAARTTVLPYVSDVGIGLDAIRYVLNTHSDFDHIGGNAAVRDACGDAIFLCHERDRRMIEDVEILIADRYGEFATAHGIDEDDDSRAFIRGATRTTSIDMGVSGGEWLHLDGGWSVEVLHTPGHSWGHLSVWDPRSRALVVGDAVLWNAVLLADGTPAFPPTYRYVDTYLATIDRFIGLAPEMLMTAHYPTYSNADAIDFLCESRNYVSRIDDMLRTTLADASDGVTMRQLIEALAPRLGSWPAVASSALAYPFAGHLERMIAYGEVTVSHDAASIASFRWEAR